MPVFSPQLFVHSGVAPAVLGGVLVVGAVFAAMLLTRERRRRLRASERSAELERLSKVRSRVPSLKVTTPMLDQSGQHLDYGSVEIEFVNARVTGYTVDGKLESWRAVDFEAVHRTTISRKSGI